LNVPRFLRFPVFGFFLPEYKRNWPDLSFLIMTVGCRLPTRVPAFAGSFGVTGESSFLELDQDHLQVVERLVRVSHGRP
jgi:hypothetical protein